MQYVAYAPFYVYNADFLLTYVSFLDISSVQVGGYTVQDWVCFDPLTTVAASDITDCHRHPEVKRKLYSSFAECDEGELAVPIPRQVSVKPAATSRGVHVNGYGAYTCTLLGIDIQ